MRAVICGAAVVLGVGACSSPSPSTRQPAAKGPGATAAEVPRPPTLLRVVAHDFAYDGNHTVLAGLVEVRLVNEGRAIHMLALARMDSGHTVGDVYAAYGRRPMPWLHVVGGPGDISAGDSATAYVVLEPGTYAMICGQADSTGKDHIMDGMFATLTVTGTIASPPVEPTPDVSVRESDYEIEMLGTLSAGRHVFHVDNDGPQRHDLVIVKILGGYTQTQALDWLMRPTMRAPEAVALGGTVGLDQGAHTEFVVNLPPGDYVFACMMIDRTDHKPHFVHGMVRAVKVG